MARDTDRLAAGLRTYLPRGAGITGVTTLSAGHSNETYLVDGIGEVLRMPPSEEGLLPPMTWRASMRCSQPSRARRPASRCRRCSNCAPIHQ